MSQQCLPSQNLVIALEGKSRAVALMRFIQLQQAGYLPAMYESENGDYTVCYDAAERL